MSGVTFDRVSKIYPDGTRAVNDLNLEIRDGEFMVLVGPSGCGKTTALRMVAGLEEISEGVLRIGERVVNHVPSRDRDIAMVFQSYALYPHLTVYENIAFGLRVKKVPKPEIESRVNNAAHVLGLDPFLHRKPRALSGGQRQRVAMGRAIVRQPQAFLMDEPLSNLDAKLRVQMRAEISRLQNDLGVTTVYVTHDQVEAMTMGDRVAVIRKGELQQVATPQELYDEPVNLFVGGFIGSPSMNMVEAGLVRANGDLAADLGEQRLTLDPQMLADRPALAAYEGKNVILGIRPEHLEDAALVPDHPPDRCLRGNVVLREALGSEIMAHFTVDAPPALTEDVKELAQDLGDERVVQEVETGGVRRRRWSVASARVPGFSRAKSPRSQSTPAHFISSTPTPVLGSMQTRKQGGHRMSRFRLTTVALALVALSVVAAGTSANAQKSAISGNISMIGIWTGPEQKSMQAVINAFQKKFPGVKVKYTSGGDNTPTILVHRGAGRESARRGSGGPARAGQGLRKPRRPQADLVRTRDDREELFARLDQVGDRERQALWTRLQGSEQVDRLVQRARVQGCRGEVAEDVPAARHGRKDAARIRCARLLRRRG